MDSQNAGLAETPPAAEAATLNKNVFSLVMRPSPEQRPTEITGLQRTIFNAMIKQAKDAPGEQAHVLHSGLKWYRISLREVAAMYGIKRADLWTVGCKRATYQLMSITVNFEPPSGKDMDRLRSQDDDLVEAEVLENGQYVKKQLRIKLSHRHMLDKVEWVELDGELNILYRFDDQMEPLILGRVKGIPFAQINFLAYGSLKGQAAKALYEIVVRTKDTESGSTGYKPWSWWVEALTFKPTTGPYRSKTYDEFRYFKARVVEPAMAELNENSVACGFTVEMLPPKRGSDKRISEIAFKVTKLDAVQQNLQIEKPIGGHLLSRCSALGISEANTEKLIKKHGVQAFTQALDNLEQMLASKAEDPDAEPIRSNHAYVKGILERMAGAVEPTNSREKPHAARGPQDAPTPASVPSQSEGTSNPTRTKVMDAIEAMSDVELEEVAAEALKGMPPLVANGPAGKALRSKNWSQPIARSFLQKEVGKRMFGPDWDKQ